MTVPAIPSSDVITVGVADHIATVWLDRPEARNAMAPEFWHDLPLVMEALSADPEVRVVVIAAKGPTFTAGIDLKAFGPAFISGGADPSGGPHGSDVAKRMALYQSIKDLQRTFTAVAECRVPVIAAVHGHCIGAGIDLITACDIRFASADAVFSVRETRIAMVADVGTLQRLPHIVEPGRLADIVYSGRDFDADEALEMGLVSRIADDAEGVWDMANDLARAIAANSPLAVQGAKAVLRAGEGRSVAENLDYVALWNSSFIGSNDFAEATMAFLEKRDPDFTGE